MGRMSFRAKGEESLRQLNDPSRSLGMTNPTHPTHPTHPTRAPSRIETTIYPLPYGPDDLPRWIEWPTFPHPD